MGMASEAEPASVSEYHFIDDVNQCNSFHRLPLQWSDGERQDSDKVKIVLHGTADNGGNLCTPVTSWKFDVSGEEPRILVLSEGNSWIKLGKPRKSFEETVRSILITVHCIHYLLRNPEKSGESVWNHLCEVFRLYEGQLSRSDILDHMPLIRDCVNIYCALADSKFLAKLFEEKTMKRKLSDEDTEARKKHRIITDDVKDDMIDHAEDEGNAYLFGEVCALCDDGGKIICCEGGCFRSFHATEEAGAGSYCKSLGFMQDDVVAIQNFYCKNCEHKQHQCFICGKLGSSDKPSSTAEVVCCASPIRRLSVVCCASPICGRFYHPHCVAILLYQDNGIPAKELEGKIADGEPFTCSIHKCCICKQGENKKHSELQFAVCMRCPKSYHRKCLPREIAFENQVEVLEGRSIIRAWDGLLPNRILIYCTNHEIDVAIGTVRRDHLKFPDVKQNMSPPKRNMCISEQKWKPISELLVDGDKVVAKRNIPTALKKQGKKISKLMSEQKPVSKMSCKSLGESDPVPSKLVKQKLSLVQVNKTTFVKDKAPTALKKQGKKMMSEQKPVSKKSNSSCEESLGESSDAVLSKLVKQKVSPVKRKKTNNVKEKTIVDRDQAVLKRTPSSEGLYRNPSAPTICKRKQSFVEQKRTLTAEFLVEEPLPIQKKKTSPGQRKTSAEEEKKLTSELPIDQDEAGCKKGSPLKGSLSATPSTVSKLRQKSSPAVKLGSADGRIQFNIPNDADRMCTTSNPGFGNEKGCKRQNWGKLYSNDTNQKLRTEFDRVPQACIKGKRDPYLSRGNDVAGQTSVYDHIRTFSSTFYSHVADSLFRIRGSARPPDATEFVDPRGYLDWCLDFAPGPYLNYSLQNSAGWINE